MKKILCVDGNSILNRAFYGIRPLTTKDGISTNAVYGYLNILYRQVESLQPDYLVAAFDVHEPTFRHKAYDQYKAGRHETPPELLMQFPYAKEVSKALGFYVAECPGYEADDILGTCAQIAEDNDMQAYLLTGDKDSLQLISDKVTVLLAKNQEQVPFTPAHFREVYGVEPTQFVDVKALMGDSSDHIPGVKGIGEKTALKLIAEYHDLDTLYEGIEQKKIAAGVLSKLMADRESAVFSKYLATIIRNAPVGFTLADVENKGMDKALMRNLCMKLEFSRFLKQFSLEEEQPQQIETTADVPAPTLRRIAPDALKEQTAPLSMWQDEENAYFSDGKTVFPVSLAELRLSGVLDKLIPQLIVYDSKLFYHALDADGMQPKNVRFDVMLGAYCLDSTGKYTPDVLMMQYLHRFVDVKALDAAQMALDLYTLWQIIAQKLNDCGMEKLYQTVELPLSMVLYHMEKEGFSVNLDGISAFGDKLGALCDKYAERVWFAAGEEFNLNSPKQLGEILFDKLCIPSPTKKRSTSADVLEKLRPYYPIVSDILEYRQVMKLKSTYADGLLKVADANGRIHTTFHQTVTATGRLSSTEPNLQNIPIRTDMGRELRRYFIAKDENHVLVDADYSQIELRLLAAISGDETMIDAFCHGVDIHTITASQVFHVQKDMVTPQMRKRAKAVNFGIVYGIGDFSLAGDIGVSRKEAATYIALYKATYPKVSAYLEHVVAQAKENGYVTTLFGRRRYIPELSSTKKMMVAFGERVAMNSPIQGSAADIIKLAMIHIFQRLEKEIPQAKLILQVHDELLIDCPKEQAEAVKVLMREEMEHTVSLAVPLTVDVQSGENWYEGH